MEFKTLKNIESSFRHLRLFSMLFLGACTLISVAAVWTSYRFAEAQRQKIYVLDQGKSLILALSQDMAQNRPVEAREHVRRFHELFFTLSPDREAIEGNVRRALYLADGSAIAYYQSLAEKGYFNRNLLHQAVLAGEILNAGHWGSFLQIGMHAILTMLYCGK